MIRKVEIERFTVISSKPFDHVVAAVNAAVGHPNMAEFGRSTHEARSFVELKSAVEKGLSKAGLMLFMQLDQGAVVQKETGKDKPRIIRLLIGNPLIMKEMAKHVPDAGSYAPVTVLVDERPDGVHLSYDRMASFLRPYGNAEALKVAKDLDAKVEALLASAAAQTQKETFDMAEKTTGARVMTESAPHVRVIEETPAHWRVVFDYPPFNMVDATIFQGLQDLLARMDASPSLRVVAFESANPEFYLAHFDLTRKTGNITTAVGTSGLPILMDTFVRLTKSPVVSIAKIRGCVRGVSSEFVLACDMRFASRENTRLGQPEVGVGVHPGGWNSPRLRRPHRSPQTHEPLTHAV